MARGKVLDQGLLDKLVKKIGKKKQYVREQISKRASRTGLDSKVVQVLWAKELGIGTTRFQQQLEPHLQEQVRQGLPTIFNAPKAKSKNEDVARRATKSINPIRLAIEFLIEDEELKSRCARILAGRRHHDTAVREATTVLDHRLKELGGIKKRMNAEALVGKVLNPDPNKSVLVVSEEGGEQRGFHALCQGLMLAFRNPAHHGLDDDIDQRDALRLCAFVDALLGILDKAEVHPERV